MLAEAQTRTATKRRVRRRSFPLSDELPDELLAALLAKLTTVDLRAAAETCRHWREMVAVAAELCVRKHNPYLPSASSGGGSPCWLRSLLSVELLAAAVGPRPQHSWREDYVDLHVEAERLRWETEEDMPFDRVAANYRTDFSDDGDMSLKRMKEEYKVDQAQLRRAGWGEDDALLTVHVTGVEVNHLLVESYRERRNTFAASLHSTVAAYTAAAMRDRSPAPVCYWHLCDLAKWSVEWACLPTLALGESFFCVGGASAREPLDCYFPNDLGMHEEKSVLRPGGDGVNLEDWMTEFVFVDSPCVRFVSSAPDRNGFHSLIQDAFDERMRSGRHEVASWSIPFLSTVTLIERHGPGEWEVYPTKYGLRPSKRGLRVQQTRYTVTVSFG